jgi:hypothetical protein
MITDSLILELFSLALKVNQETKYAVYCGLRGHVKYVELRVATDKDVLYNEIIYDIELYLYEDSEERVKGAINYLNSFLQ